jgi:uncharacterized protein (DUF58 family)
MIPTFRGVLMALLLAPVIALGTWVPRAEWLSLALGVAIIGVLVLDWYAAGTLADFEVNRTHDQKLSLGAENAIHLSVRSLRRRPTLLWIRDEPPDEFDVDQRILSGSIPPRGLWEAIYHVVPHQRGNYRFGNINLRWQGPLGLVIRQAAVPCEAAIKVYPNLMDVRRYDLLLRRNRLQELGLRNTRQFGEGNEFERLREYLPDDEFRRIDWKATARRNKPITVEYQTERSQSIMTVIDTGRMMQSPVARIAKLDYVINSVLLLGYVATGMGDKVGMMTFADDVNQFLAPKQGRGHFFRMLEVLYAVKPQSVEPNYRRALSYLSVKQHKRTLIVIFTDLSGGVTMESLVAHVAMLARNHLPLVVTISDPDVFEASRQIPDSSHAVYQRAAALQLLEDRRVVLQTLEQRGVPTLDVPANQLSWSVVNRYLELKGKGML